MVNVVGIFWVIVMGLTMVLASVAVNTTGVRAAFRGWWRVVYALFAAYYICVIVMIGIIFYLVLRGNGQ